MHTPQALTQLQRNTLEQALRLRLAELEQHSRTQLDNQSQAQHAYQTLEQDKEDAPQRSGAEEVAAAVADIDSREFGAIQQALLRIHGPDYGVCIDCQIPIAFERLQLEPQALRCIACQTLHERAALS